MPDDELADLEQATEQTSGVYAEGLVETLNSSAGDNFVSELFAPEDGTLGKSEIHVIADCDQSFTIEVEWQVESSGSTFNLFATEELVSAVTGEQYASVTLRHPRVRVGFRNESSTDTDVSYAIHIKD